MTFRAVITDVCLNPDRTATITLETDQEDIPPHTLIVTNPPRKSPASFLAVRGTKVWGVRGRIFIGDVWWASSVSLTEIELMDRADADRWTYEMLCEPDKEPC